MGLGVGLDWNRSDKTDSWPTVTLLQCAPLDAGFSSGRTYNGRNECRFSLRVPSRVWRHNTAHRVFITYSVTPHWYVGWCYICHDTTFNTSQSFIYLFWWRCYLYKITPSCEQSSLAKSSLWIESPKTYSINFARASLTCRIKYVRVFSWDLKPESKR